MWEIIAVIALVLLNIASFFLGVIWQRGKFREYSL